MKRIIVTRFSAMGDVAMVASVLKEFITQHDDVEIIMVSRKLFAPFFADIPRVRFHPIDPKGKHKGVLGLYRLFRELKGYKSFYVADLHNNLRSRFLDFLFLTSDYSVRILDKGRSEKKALTRSENKVLKPLKPTTERYADVFRRLGYSFKLDHELPRVNREAPEEYTAIFASRVKTIGIAPFAQHPYKVFPLAKMEDLIGQLSEKDCCIFLFGGGEREKEICAKWSNQYDHVINTVGQYSLAQELDIIANLDLMVSMDSSGMHMASLVGSRCVSIWGATHPYAGFLGYGQRLEDCIHVEHPARPSSVYGNKPCDCDGVEAIDLVSVQMVMEKINL
ncbi:glycosyltransferase family 9 protein [Sphingobacterium alkalisoli]|uniref:Glycosyltransferase family 9 protein n=1 Tax=Sphingobacterium alkalisoli TaxID=1874115 RepID=A0A4U0GYN0_9SPHI|nr:glycosyltransferase family 9 protein [Sphingobacterium alkalisoli]TJY64218.1 glycosyltransferase family 9 protein [Sphingobacterium alkalisoli]GGH23121.1 heptosyltransferase [Sphingobacterium alkalisoli]